MIDICNCCNECSSMRQLSTNLRNSFPKKLMVVIALVVIVAMFITPSEARTLQRRRHSGDIAKNKNCDKPSRRHYEALREKQLRRLNNMAKDNNRPPNPYKEQLTKVMRKMKNTRSFFHYKKEEDLKYYEELPPSWLPKINFAEIHFHNYYGKSKERNNTVKLRSKFIYVMPKLYKSLIEYHALFEVYQKMELDFPDTLKDSYHDKRKKLLENTLRHLYSTIGEVEDSMRAVNMTVRPTKIKDFSILPTKVEMSDCFRLDYLAFRGYGNLLNNWLSELRCLKRSQNTQVQRRCAVWENRLKEKQHRMHTKRS